MHKEEHIKGAMCLNLPDFPLAAVKLERTLFFPRSRLVKCHPVRAV